MLDPETFLTELYVAADTFGKTQSSPAPAPGPAPALSAAEVITLACFSQHQIFPSEAAAYRYLRHHCVPLFPTLPSRAQFNRLLHAHADAITAFALHLGHELATGDARAYEVLDGTGLSIRNAQRRGTGWLAGAADIGWCSRLGFYEGVRLLVSTTPQGAITGWGLGPASTNDRVLAETFFAVRAAPQPGLPSAGTPTSDCYVADMGFAGKDCQQRWRTVYAADVICPPQVDSQRAWPKPLKTWLARLRQVIETVNDHLLSRCGLARERPHTLRGLLTRVAAAVGLHNVCCWLNHRAGVGLLTIADLIDW
jgi:hypothetical protein